MSKKITKISAHFITFLSFTLLILSLSPVIHTAAEPLGYTPLEPSAFSQLGVGLVDGKIQTSNLSNFLRDIFNFGIAIAVVLSVVMISWGGILYMTTDSWSGKEDGKEKIENALYGLALALVSWLILYTINPALVDFTGNRIVNTP
ncbi:MAG: pilin [Candidatus Paceibacterota bacterium]|jgi:hypothetical protein